MLLLAFSALYIALAASFGASKGKKWNLPSLYFYQFFREGQCFSTAMNNTHTDYGKVWEELSDIHSQQNSDIFSFCLIGKIWINNPKLLLNDGVFLMVMVSIALMSSGIGYAGVKRKHGNGMAGILSRYSSSHHLDFLGSGSPVRSLTIVLTWLAEAKDHNVISK